MAQFQYDATNVPQRQSREVLPSGWYLAAITETEVGAGQNPGSQIIKVEYTIQAPAEHRGRKVFDNINARNQNPTAERIGNETISSISHAVGRIRINDTTEWHGIPLAVRLTIEPATMDPNTGAEKYPAKNRVSDIKPASEYKGDTGMTGFLPTAPAMATYGTPPPANAQMGLQGAGAANWNQATTAPPIAAPVAPPAPPVQLSPDGKFQWNGQQWVPVAQQAGVQIPPPPGATTASPQAPAGATPWAGAAPGGAPGPWAQG